MPEEPIDRKTIFAEAIEIKDPAARAAYLDRACRGDARLRASVEALLRAHERAEGFLESPPAGATLDSPAQIEGPGTKIGHYELLELVGEGGMGLVYLAEQKEPVRRKVAFKIIKPGMDSKQVIARFEAERQALALLDHPNIAHVFDAGTTEAGRPYFVMEYVKGLSITRYCDDNKLTIEQRLRLFEQVCEAVHHAHQKGIIHRDLKPSNILVSVHGDRAVPKIIDFGIAKAITQPLTDKTFVTFQGQLLGTPEYMSPEQVDLATQDIDTRSDIYSLGVVLYELLAGVLPFESDAFERAGLAEIQQTIREAEPASPSIRLTSLGEKAKTIAASRGTEVVSLARRLHRELEWIPLKAMRKDRCRRYRSATEMADDVHNYLTGRPLIAGPETTIYRVQKFVHKHAGSVTTAAIIAVAILLGLVISTVMYFKAEKARVRAEKAETTAQQQREAAEQAREQEAVARVRAEEAEKVAQEQRELAEERAEDYRRSLYIHRINLADVARRDSQIGRLRSLLDSCPEDLRGWEWYRLNHISNQSPKTFFGHIDGVYDVTFAPDGKRFVSAGGDGTIKIWDATDGRELMTLHGHEFPVISVKFSPDGKRIASVCRNGKVKVWDAQSGTEMMTLTTDESLSGFLPPVWIQGQVAFSPDGKKIVAPSQYGTIKVWDANSGTSLMTLTGHKRRIKAFAFTPDGKRLVSSCGFSTLRVWDMSTGRQIRLLEGGHQGSIGDVDISPDGTRLVSASQDGTAKVWDMATGAELMTLHGHDKGVVAVVFSKDGARIVTSDQGGMIKVWDAANGTELTTLLGHLESIRALAISPDGKHIVSGSRDETIKVWPTGLEPMAPLTLQGDYHGMAFSPDGKHIVTGGGPDDSTMRVWDAATLDELMKIERAGVGGFFSPDGKRIISADNNDIYVWDASSGKKLMTLSGHEDRPLTGIECDVWSASYSPDGTRIVSGGTDKTIRVWNAATGAEIMTLRGHGDWPYYPALSPVSSVAFSPDGQLIVSSSYDHTIKIWNAGTGAEVMTLEGHSDIVSDVALSPDGKQIASASSDETIRVWDVSTGSELLTLQGHDNEVLSVTFSPDGRRIVSGSKDNTVRIWDAATGVEVQRLPIRGWVWAVCFSPDGKTLAIRSSTGVSPIRTITLWASAEPDSGYEFRETANSARELVEALYKQHNSVYEIISKLKGDTTVAEPVRRVALQIANARVPRDESRLFRDFWPVVHSPDHDEQEYQEMLEKAEKASHIAPDKFIFIVALGAAQYRVGAYEEALATLKRAEQMRDESNTTFGPVIEGYKAMALRRLGRDNEANAILQQLRNGPIERWLSLNEYTFILGGGKPALPQFYAEIEKLLLDEGSAALSVWELIEDAELDKAGEAIEKTRPLSDAEDIDSMKSAAKFLSILYYRRGNGSRIRSVEYPDMIANYEKAVGVDPNNAQALEALGWVRATCPEAEFRDGSRAVEAAKRACDLTDWKNHEYVATLAAAHSEAGDFGDAVKWQKEAVGLLPEGRCIELHTEYHERLELYESGKPYRESP